MQLFYKLTKDELIDCCKKLSPSGIKVFLMWRCLNPFGEKKPSPQEIQQIAAELGLNKKTVYKAFKEILDKNNQSPNRDKTTSESRQTATKQPQKVAKPRQKSPNRDKQDLERLQAVALGEPQILIDQTLIDHDQELDHEFLEWVAKKTESFPNPPQHKYQAAASWIKKRGYLLRKEWEEEKQKKALREKPVPNALEPVERITPQQLLLCKWNTKMPAIQAQVRQIVQNDNNYQIVGDTLLYKGTPIQMPNSEE